MNITEKIEVWGEGTWTVTKVPPTPGHIGLEIRDPSGKKCECNLAPGVVRDKFRELRDEIDKNRSL